MKTTSALSAMVALLAVASISQACKCLVPTMRGAYYSSNAERFVRATPIFTTELSVADIFTKVIYILQIETDFKGCRRSKYVTVRTSSSSASCGAKLQLFTSYVLPLDSSPFPRITSCQFIRPYNSLSKRDMQFLNSRELCCGKKCVCANGKPPVNCFVEPCRFAKPPCKEAVKCVNNYCGGCNAEWFTRSGEPACPKSIIKGNPTELSS